MPGSILPESFTPVLRFTIDSARSPITAANPRSNPSTTACVQVRTERCPGMSAKRPTLARSEKTRAPKNPSQVFFGLMCGTSLCFPITLPVRYAPMSLNFVIAMQ